MNPFLFRGNVEASIGAEVLAAGSAGVTYIPPVVALVIGVLLVGDVIDYA